LVGTGKQVIRKMQRRVTTNKLILFGIIIALILGICLIVYFSWFSGGEEPTPTIDPSATPTTTPTRH